MMALAWSSYCGQAAEGDPGVTNLLRGPTSWFQDLPTRYSKFANSTNGPALFTLKLQPGFDFLASEACQQTVRTFASVYYTTGLPFASDEPSCQWREMDMLEDADVLVADSIRVEEFASNGWLAPFDETLTNELNKAGVETIRAVGRGDNHAAPPIYGIPLTRGADFLLYRKSVFGTNDAAASQYWLTNISSSSGHVGLAADGQEFYRFYLALVWSLEPGWPRQTNGTWMVDTDGARKVLEFLARSTRIGPAATAANRSQVLPYFQRCINRFTRVAGAPDNSLVNADQEMPASCLLSLWGNRLLFAPWASMPLEDIGIMPLSASLGGTGSSLSAGKCLVLSRRLNTGDSVTRRKREGVNKLATCLLSKEGQMSLFFEQFEIPARPGLLNEIRPEDVSRAYCNRRLLLAGLAANKESEQFGSKALPLLRQVESLVRDRSQLHLHLVTVSPLSIQQCSLIDSMLHEVLGAGPPSGDLGAELIRKDLITIILLD